MPNTATSATLRVGEQRALDLGRVDVHAARDDHVGLAVAQEQVAVLVEVPDVADGEEALQAVGVGLVLVLEYSKSPCAERHVHGADLAGRQPLAVVVEDADLGARPRLPDRARLRQPLLRASRSVPPPSVAA